MNWKIFLLQHLVSFFIAAAILMIAVPVTVPLLSKTEGIVLPVVDNFKIVSQEKKDSHTFLYVTFDKKRHCEFLGINWYLGSNRLNVAFLEDQGQAPLSRPTGAQITGPWRIDSSTISGSTAEVLHRCHNLWLTTTEIYP